MYILQNQDGYFLSKAGDWTDGREPKQLFRTQLRDEATNELFEVNSRDFNLRLVILSCETTPKGVPIIPEDLLPPQLAQPEACNEADIEINPANQDCPETKTAAIAC